MLYTWYCAVGCSWICSGFKYWLRAGRLHWQASCVRESSCSVNTSAVCWTVERPTSRYRSCCRWARLTSNAWRASRHWLYAIREDSSPFCEHPSSSNIARRNAAVASSAPATPDILTCEWVVYTPFMVCLLILLNDIADQRFRLLRSMLPFRGLSLSFIVLKREKLSTGFLLHATASYLSQIVTKFGLHQWTLPPEILLQNVPPFCWFEHQRHSMDNCGRMLETAQ